MKHHIVLLALAALGAASQSRGEDLPANTVRLSSSAEHLDNGTPDWIENGAAMQLGLGPRELLDLSATQVRRFGLSDDAYGAGFTMPLSGALTGSLSASASPTHHVLAQRVLGGELQYEFAKGWLLHGGAKSSSFDAATVNTGKLALEHYFGNWSASAGWNPTHTYGRNASGAELRAAYYYGERNAVSLILAGGQEAASVPGGVVLTDVRSAALTGRHWFSPRWAATWAVSHTRQGSLYSRNGLSLGAQYAF